VDETVDLNLEFDAPNTGYTGAYPIAGIGLQSEGYGLPSASCNNLTSVVSFIGPAAGSGNYTYQAIGTTNELAQVLEPYAQYLKLHASITIRNGREKNVDDLTRKLEAETLRMQSTITNRAEEPSQPPLSNRDGLWDDGCTDVEWAR
jgi:hypothetical protein